MDTGKETFLKCLCSLCIIFLIERADFHGGEHELNLRSLFVPAWLWFVEKYFLKSGMLRDFHNLHCCINQYVDLGLCLDCQVTKPCSDSIAQETFCCSIIVGEQNFPVQTDGCEPSQKASAVTWKTWLPHGSSASDYYLCRCPGTCRSASELMSGSGWPLVEWSPKDLESNIISCVFLCWHEVVFVLPLYKNVNYTCMCTTHTLDCTISASVLSIHKLIWI